VSLWSKIVENNNVNFVNEMRNKLSKGPQLEGDVSGFELLALQQ
jgi:hypothetical protein